MFLVLALLVWLVYFITKVFGCCFVICFLFGVIYGLSGYSVFALCVGFGLGGLTCWVFVRYCYYYLGD